MAQKFDYLESEAELRKTLDRLYNISKSAKIEGKRPSIKGLVEIMASKITIVTAIHNIKSNKGSKTPGIDSKTMQNDYLEKTYEWVIEDIQNAFKKFIPQKIIARDFDQIIARIDNGAQNYHKIGLCQHSMVDKNQPGCRKVSDYKTIFVSEC